MSIVIVSDHSTPGVAAAGAESRGAGVGAQAGTGGQHRCVGALGVAACLHRVQPRLLDSLQLGTAGYRQARMLEMSAILC